MRARTTACRARARRHRYPPPAWVTLLASSGRGRTMTHRVQSLCGRALIALLAVCIAAPAAAQTYPTKSIRFIVAYAPGGGTDVTARPIAAKLSERYGQSVFVDNRAGGNGMIGADLVAKSAPDGYTVLVSASSEMSMNVALFSKMPYDP